MKKPRMIGTILPNGFGNTSAGPVITVWTGAYSTRSCPVSSRRKCAERCGVTRNDEDYLLLSEGQALGVAQHVPQDGVQDAAVAVVLYLDGCIQAGGNFEVDHASV